MADMKSCVATVVIIAAAALLAALGGMADSASAREGTAPRATLATFAGSGGATLEGSISARPATAARISDGCCYRVIDLSFRLAKPLGTSRDAIVTLRVTKVRLYNTAIYWKNRPLPKIGQRGQLRLRNGVLTESLTDTIFCAPGSPPAAPSRRTGLPTLQGLPGMAEPATLTGFSPTRTVVGFSEILLND